MLWILHAFEALCRLTAAERPCDCTCQSSEYVKLRQLQVDSVRLICGAGRGGDAAGQLGAGGRLPVPARCRHRAGQEGGILAGCNWVPLKLVSPMRVPLLGYEPLNPTDMHAKLAEPAAGIRDGRGRYGAMLGSFSDGAEKCAHLAALSDAAENCCATLISAVLGNASNTCVYQLSHLSTGVDDRLSQVSMPSTSDNAAASASSPMAAPTPAPSAGGGEAKNVGASVPVSLSPVEAYRQLISQPVTAL